MKSFTAGHLDTHDFADSRDSPDPRIRRKMQQFPTHFMRLLRIFAASAGSLAFILTLHISLRTDPASAQANSSAVSSRGFFDFGARSSASSTAPVAPYLPPASTEPANPYNPFDSEDRDLDGIPDFADPDDDNDGVPDDRDTPEIDASPNSKGYLYPVVPQQLPPTGGGFRAHSRE